MSANSKARRKAKRQGVANVKVPTSGGQKPYLHVTINTGDCGMVDHTQPGWQVSEWMNIVSHGAQELAKSGGLVKLPGDVAAIVSSNSGDDGQMAFTLIFGDEENQIIGSYSDNPTIGHRWLKMLTDECVNVFGRLAMPAYPFPPGTDWLDQPWLAVAYRPLMPAIFLNTDDYPLRWTEYEQLLVDAWQTMTPAQKQSMRRNTPSMLVDLFNKESE